jgi:hypothetical protein
MATSSPPGAVGDRSGRHILDFAELLDGVGFSKYYEAEAKYKA